MENNKQKSLNILFLKQGDIEVGLLPELGGSIAFAKFNNIDFMRPWNGELTPRRTCCYPLVPFSNRIADGRFKFQNKDYQLAKNFGDHPHTIHGVGWQRPWQVCALSENTATLYYEHNPQLLGADTWPFAFVVTQNFEISNGGLLVSMMIENKENYRVPVGFGWHPFFPYHDKVLLQFDAEKVVLNSDNMLPEKIIKLPKKWNFNHPKSPKGAKLDNCFVNWQHQAIIEWPGKNLSLSLTASDALSHLVVMTPPVSLGSFFAVEPVSHINNAINTQDPKKQGIHFLEKNQKISGWMHFCARGI